jgi:hypothetical protein
MEQSAAVHFTDASGKRRKKRRWWLILLIIVIVLVIIRLILPYFVLKYVNKTLAESKTYPGHVEDVDLAIIRGAYVIKGVRLDKNDTLTGKKDSIPFFTSPKVDLSVEWGALLKGKLAGEIKVDQPKLNFVKGRHKDEDVKQDTTDFRDMIRDLMPLKINRFEIRDGEIHYIDPYSKPRIDVLMSNIKCVATNLTNADDSSKVLPASLKATADVYSGGLELNMKLDPLNKQPTFDMNANVTAVDMTRLNDFFKAYGNFDVKQGSFGLYTEFAAKEGKFKGYVKPLLKELDIVQWNKEEGNLGQKLWESVVGVVGEVFENQPREQVATKVPIEGTFDNPEISLWNAVAYVLRNAFVYALKPSIDQTIDIGKVEDVDVKKPLLQQIFGKDKDKKSEGSSKEKSGRRKNKDGDKR